MGSLEVEIVQIQLSPGTNERAVIRTGGCLTIDVTYAHHAPLQSFVCTITLLQERNKLIVARCVCGAEGEIRVRDTGTLRLHVPRVDLAPGAYEVEVGLYPTDFRYAYDYHWNTYRLSVDGEASEGCFQVPASWSEVAPSSEQPLG